MLILMGFFYNVFVFILTIFPSNFSIFQGKIFINLLNFTKAFQNNFIDIFLN